MYSPDYAAARRKRLHQVLIFFLCLITSLVYSNSFLSGFPQDNQKMILLDGRITAVNPANLKLIFNHGYWYPIETSGLYRPVTTLSYLFNYSVLGNGVHPTGYHVVNLVLQWLNVALVYLLAWELLRDISLAFAISALWSMHPLLTESVTNIIGRSDLISGAAVLGGLILHIRSPGARGIGLLAAIATIGIFSKESAAVLPVLMAVYDLTFRRRKPIQPGAYMATIVPLLFCWWVRSRVLEPAFHAFVDNPLVGAGFWSRELTALKIVGRYLWLLVFPGRLSNDYSYNQIPLVTSRPDGQTLAGIGACLVLLVLAIVCWRRHKVLFFFITYSALTFIPSSNLLVRIGSIMAERFMYLPAVGFAACIAVGLRRAAEAVRQPWLAHVAVALLCIALGARTFARNADWRDNETLFASSVAASPASFKTHLALARVLSTKKPPELDAAVREMERSLAILSTLPDARKPAFAYGVAGEIYRKKADLEKARDILLQGVAVDRLRNQQNRAMWVEKGVKASQIRTIGLADVYIQLGATYLALNEPRLALEAFQYGRELTPYNPDFYGGIANAYAAMQDYRQQAITLLEGLSLLPREPRLATALTAAYAHIDTGGCRGSELDPVTGLLHVNLSCPVVQEQVCAARENLVRMFIEVNLEREAEKMRDQALAQVRCPPRQFDIAIPKEP